MRSALILSVFAAAGLAGCSVVRTGEDATTRIVGFVDMEIQSQDDSETFAGYVADIETIGIGVVDAPTASGLSLGYSRQRIGFLRNNVLVLGDALTLTGQTSE